MGSGAGAVESTDIQVVMSGATSDGSGDNDKLIHLTFAPPGFRA